MEEREMGKLVFWFWDFENKWWFDDLKVFNGR